MPIPLLDLTRELGPLNADILEHWRRLLERPRFFNGEYVKAFEAEMATFLGMPHVIGVASGTTALTLGLAACGIGEGDEVILPANAFVAALEAVWWLKAKPVFVDIQPWDLGPDPEQIRHRLTRKTKALLVVHLYGLPVNLGPLLEICKASGIQLIEDCSHAHGATYLGQRVGSFGTVGCFSAGVVKNLGACGEAGFVATQEAEIAQRLRLLRAHGQEEKNVHLRYGTNGRLDELQAVVLRLKLPKLDERNQRRREIARMYSDAFVPLELTLPWEESRRVSVYHQYVIRTPQRNALRAHLYERGIETGIHYPTPLHQQPAWRASYRQTLSFPHAERAAQEILSLPVFSDLSHEEINAVIDGVCTFFVQQQKPSLRPQLSFVVPFHNEAGNVEIVTHELQTVVDRLKVDYECLFVNDGSTDETGALLNVLARVDQRVRVIHLPENQGEAAALSAGFHQARGRVIVTLDGDGQNDPADIPLLLAKIEEGYPIVTGWRRQRREGYWARVLPSRIANALIAWVTGMPIHDCGCGLKAYRREMLAGLTLPHGMHRFLPVLLQAPPEAIAEVAVQDRARTAGASHYGLSRLFAVLRDLLPLHCIRRNAVTVIQGISGVVFVTVLLLVYLIHAEVIAASIGKLAGLCGGGLSLVYLSLVQRRIQEFVQAQLPQRSQLPAPQVKVEG